MPLPSTGPISMGDVRTQLSRTDPISFGEGQVRTLARRPSGEIAMGHLHGKDGFRFRVRQVYVGGVDATIIGFNSNSGTGAAWNNQYKGATITGIFFDPVNRVFNLQAQGQVARGLWSSMLIQNWSVYNNSALSYEFNAFFNLTIWSLNGVSPPSGFVDGAELSISFL